MKRLLLRFMPAFVALILCLSIRPSFAQQPSLSVQQINNFPDTVAFNQFYDSITVVVANLNSIATFQDTLWVFIGQDDTLSATLIDTLIFAPGFTIQGGAVSSVTRNQYQISTSVFKPGGNTVVVWPYAKNASTFDSLRFNLFVDPGVGIEVPKNEVPTFLIFPNPAQNYLSIASNKMPEQVRIYDSSGRLIYDLPYHSNKLYIEALLPGIYVVQCRFENSKSSYRKLFKD